MDPGFLLSLIGGIGLEGLQRLADFEGAFSGLDFWPEFQGPS